MLIKHFTLLKTNKHLNVLRLFKHFFRQREFRTATSVEGVNDSWRWDVRCHPRPLYCVPILPQAPAPVFLLEIITDPSHPDTVHTSKGAKSEPRVRIIISVITSVNVGGGSQA